MSFCIFPQSAFAPWFVDHLILQWTLRVHLTVSHRKRTAAASRRPSAALAVRNPAARLLGAMRAHVTPPALLLQDGHFENAALDFSSLASRACVSRDTRRTAAQWGPWPEMVTHTNTLKRLRAAVLKRLPWSRDFNGRMSVDVACNLGIREG